MWRLGRDPAPWGEGGRGVTEIRSIRLPLALLAPLWEVHPISPSPQAH